VALSKSVIVIVKEWVLML